MYNSNCTLIYYNYRSTLYYYIIFSLYIRHTDLALLLPSNQSMAYECVVHAVQRDSVILKLTKKAHSAW